MMLSLIKYAVGRFKKKADWRDINRVRHGFEKISTKYAKINKACSYEPFMLEHMKAEWIKPIGRPDTNRVLLYFHGGGYAAGSINTHRPHISQLVMLSGIKALMIEYRLAPEHKYPAQIDDAVLAYDWLLKNNYLPDRIAFGGDSAGGGLAIASLLYLRDHGKPLPKCAICLSPWLDLTLSGESHAVNEKLDVMLVREAFPLWVKNYLGEVGPRTPYASPVFADLHGLPPIYIQVGTVEMLQDDSILFAEKAKAAGVDIKIDIYPGYFHVFQAFFRILKVAREANKKLAAFMVEQIGG
jgi:monoterpene epsilon-lactone hydrolase